MQNQPTSIQDQSQNVDLLRLKDLLQTSTASFYMKKILRLILEILFYFFGAMIMIGAFQIPMNPIGGSQELNESVTLVYNLNIEELTALMLTLRIFLILFSLLFFLTAYSLGSSRRKSNTIKKGHDILAGNSNTI